MSGYPGAAAMRARGNESSAGGFIYGGSSAGDLDDAQKKYEEDMMRRGGGGGGGGGWVAHRCAGGRSGGGGTVRAILEPRESAAVQAAELSEAQWQAVQLQCRTRGCPLSERSIPLDGKTPTLISSYHKVSNFATKYLFEEADGTRRDGAPGTSVRPRFLTPRECARVMGFPDTYRIPDGDEAGFYRQVGNAVPPPVVEAVGERVLQAIGLAGCSTEA